MGAPVPTLDLTPPIFSQTQTSSELRPLIKSQRRFEHVLTGASSSYLKVRQEIAARAFGSSIYIHTDDKSEQEETVLLANRQILEQAIR